MRETQEWADWELDVLEKHYLDWARSRPGSDPATLAGRLGISQRTLYRKLQAKV